MDICGILVIHTGEVFRKENGMLVSNKLYEGISTSNGGVNVGYKVMNENGKFLGLLDHEKMAVWWTEEDTLKLL